MLAGFQKCIGVPLIVLNAFSERVKILWVLFTKNAVKPVKKTTLGTT